MLFNTPGPLIEANINLGGLRRDFNVSASGLSQNVLEVSGEITNGQINKATGSGTPLLTNSGNSFGLNEAQTLTNSAAMARSRSVLLGSAATPALAFNIAASSGTPGDPTTLQGNLENLSTIGVGNVTVSAPPAGRTR